MKSLIAGESLEEVSVFSALPWLIYGLDLMGNLSSQLLGEELDRGACVLRFEEAQQVVLLLLPSSFHPSSDTRP